MIVRVRRLILRGETSPLGTVAYQYDAAGRRTRITFPGTTALFVQYDYDMAGAMIAVKENGAASGLGLLATYAWDNLGRRTSVSRGNGVTTTLGFDNVSRLASLAHNPTGTAQDLTLGLAYSPASAIAGQTSTNASFDWTNPADFANAYTVNGLNQYLTAAGSVTHDARGNLTGDPGGVQGSTGAKTYAYDADNRLISVAGAASATLSYDPAGRLYQLAATAPTATTTKFLYDGPQAIAEYDGAATPNLLRRYVPGAGVNEPVAWLEGAGTTDRRWLLPDARGSIVAVTNGSGAATAFRRSI